MTNKFYKALGVTLLGAIGVGAAQAQTGWFECIDPMNTMPRSPDWSSARLINELFGVTVGQSGTITYGGQNGPCFAPAITNNLAGRIGFRIGTIGSVQSGFDDLLNLTFGMPLEPAGTWGAADYVVDGTRTRFGGNGLNVFYTGESDHYTYAEVDATNITIKMRADLIGDAARLNWDLVNTDTQNTHNFGLWFGQWTAMLNNQDEDSGFASRGNYVVVPGEKPLLSTNSGGLQTLTKRWIRSQDPSVFPKYVNFDFSQRDAYGLTVDNGPTAATSDAAGNNSDATSADEFAVGSDGGQLAPGLLGGPAANNNIFPDVILPDTATVDTAYIQKFYDTGHPVAPNGTRTIVQYFHSTSGNANYARPYSVVVDAPRIVGNDPAGANGLSNNDPMMIRVYVDNTRGFSQVNQDIEIDDVKITLTLPTGITFLPGETAQKVISRIMPRQMGFVDYQVQADGIEFGDLKYTVKVDPIPGPAKTITGYITVAATPRIRLQPQANLIAMPFLVTDTSWEAILGLNQPTDFVAYQWDPVQKGYIISTSAVRGKGFWIVYNGGGELSQMLNGNPQVPPDVSTGSPLIQLKSGWNLIGDPYPYAFPMGQIVGVSASNPTQSYTWQQLVDQGIVSSSMAYWDPITQSYRFIGNPIEKIQPNRGYWVYVYTAQDLTLSFPPIYQEFLPEGTRGSIVPAWQQTDKQWRLKLSARTNVGIDDMNFVGRALDAKNARNLRIMEPPTAPTQDVALSIGGVVNGQQTRMAQSLTEATGRQEWKVSVQNVSAGPVTVTWPNLGTVPPNVRLRLVDLSTNSTRDLRQSSGYTYTAAANSTREFKIQMETGVAAGAAVIGNVVVQGGGTRGSGAITINYTLSRGANTSIRILSGSGKEVRTLRLGRAENPGENSATWTLTDNANRSVPPGSYRVEILAETSAGDRVRKTVPVNVVRG